jgi:hypothetical protein
MSLKLCAAYCRRHKARTRLQPAAVTAWSATSDPRPVTVVEADACGARLVLPFEARVDELIRVCFADAMGFHQTRRARVAWTHRFTSANRLMVGLAFDEEMEAA